MMKRFTINLPDNIYQAVRLLGYKKSLSLAGVVRDACTEYAREHLTAAEKKKLKVLDE